MNIKFSNLTKYSRNTKLPCFMQTKQHLNIILYNRLKKNPWSKRISFKRFRETKIMRIQKNEGVNIGAIKRNPVIRVTPR